MFGINGRQAVDQFTVVKKNANSQTKQKYWCRDKVSQTIARLVRGWWGIQVAINQIQSAYG